MNFATLAADPVGHVINHKFITDGDPTHARTYPYWWNYWWTSDTDRYNWTTTQAANAANFARERDGRTIGILVGDADHGRGILLQITLQPGD